MTDGDGGSRDPFLEKRGITTYLIQQDAQDDTEPSQEAGELNSVGYCDDNTWSVSCRKQ